MKRKTVFLAAAIAGILGGNLAMVNVAQAWDMGDMMDPGEWFGDDDDDYYRYGYGGPYGYGGYGPYGYGGYGPYGYGGYGGPWGGYGGYGPYGYGGYGGYPGTIVVNPQQSGSGSSAPRAPR